MNHASRYLVGGTQILLIVTFTAIPISRMLGACTQRQVVDLGTPDWLVRAANIVELTGAAGLLIGLRRPPIAVAGACCVIGSMAGATVLHIRSANLFTEIPWTLVILVLGLVVAIARLYETGFSHDGLLHGLRAMRKTRKRPAQQS